MTIERGKFIREYLRHPLRTAAILPSSPGVARDMTAAVPADGDPVVVELGPGTGVFTAEIERRLGGRGHLLAVELNDNFAAQLRDRFPKAEVATGDAVRLRELLDERGIKHADVIISGLPHALFPHPLQQQFMNTFTSCLAPHGRLVAHAYVHAAWSPRARHFRRLLDTEFGDVAVGKVHWTNVFPVFVYVAGGMRRRSLDHSSHSAPGSDTDATPWSVKP